MNMFKGKNVLVTGGSGFIATNLIRKLYKFDCNITATYHNKNIQMFMPSTKFVKCDLTDKDCCHEITRNKDYVFMCAANSSGAAVMEQTPLAHVTPNVAMNSYMLEAAHKNKVRKFMFLSSTTIYPLTDKPLKEDDALTGPLFDKYFCVGWMKVFSEKLCEMYATKINNPMDVIVVRPGNIYGKYDNFEWETSHVIPALIRRVVERHDPIEVWGDGEEIKDLTYVVDLVDGLILMMEKMKSFDIVHLASGRSCTIKDVLNTIIDIEGYTGANVVYDTSKPTMIPKRLINIEKAESLGYKAPTSLRDGLNNTIKWYKNNLVYAS